MVQMSVRQSVPKISFGNKWKTKEGEKSFLHVISMKEMKCTINNTGMQEKVRNDNGMGLLNFFLFHNIWCLQTNVLNRNEMYRYVRAGKAVMKHK